MTTPPTSPIFSFAEDHPVFRHTIPNGPKVILAPHRQAPVISFQIWLPIGSKHEKPGQTGIAHFLEHLMFGATKKHSSGQFDRIIENLGGYTNAATWVDWTYYECLFPKAAFATVCELEADRLTNLLLRDEDIEAERHIIFEERQQTTTDDIDGTMQEELYKLAFQQYTYGHPTIGWEQDILSITPQQIRDFYRQHYRPQAVTIVVAGDFCRKEALATIQNHFAASKPTSKPISKTMTSVLPYAPPPILVQEPPQEKPRSTTIHKTATTQSCIVSFKTPAQAHPDWPVLEVLCAYITGGPSAALHKELVIDNKIAISVSASLPPFAEPGLLQIGVVLREGIDASAAIDKTEAILTEIKKGQVDEQVFYMAAATCETQYWADLVTLEGKAEALGHFETTQNDASVVLSFGKALPQITPEAMTKVAATYLIPSHQNTLILVPQ